MPTNTSPYPNLRMRRTRATSWSRALHRENILTPVDLIWPLFVIEGESIWIPFSQIAAVSKAHKTLTVSKWIADQKGLEYED